MKMNLELYKNIAEICTNSKLYSSYATTNKKRVKSSSWRNTPCFQFKREKRSRVFILGPGLCIFRGISSYTNIDNFEGN